MVCKSLPGTPTASHHSSFWTTSSRSSSSSQTSILDSRKTLSESTFEQAEGFNLHNPSTPRHTPPDELRAQPTTRPTPDISSSHSTALGIHLPVQEPYAVNSDRCLAIIQVLRTPFVDIQTFYNVTPAEYNFIVGFVSEQQRDRIPAKLIYNADLCNLIAMAPYQIHEVPFQHLSKRIHQLFASLSLDDSCRVTWNTHFNLCIENETTIIIPDMHLDLRPRRPPGVRAIPFWVGECGFSSLQKEMEHQLKAVAGMVPELDVAIMASVRERKSHLPFTNHPLHSLPALPRSAFVPTVAPMAHSLEPVVVEGITWLDVKSVIFRVFLRRPDGTFDFKERGSFYAQGTLFPNLQMDDIDNMLNKATKRLILQFARMMEEAGTDPVSVARLRAKSESTLFPGGWSLLLEELQHSLYDTAHSRYYKWLRQTSASETLKRKGDHPSSDLDIPSKRLALPSPSNPQTTGTDVAKKRQRKKKGRSRK